MPGSEDVRDDLTLEVHDGDGNKPSQQGSSGHVERETEPPGGGGEQRRGEGLHDRVPPRDRHGARAAATAQSEEREDRDVVVPRDGRAGIPGRPSLDATDRAPRGRER